MKGEPKPIDPFPDEFAIDIDRAGLTRYWRKLGRSIYTHSFSLCGGFAGFILGAFLADALYFLPQPWRGLVGIGGGLLAGIVAGLLLVPLAYRLRVHRQARERAEAAFIAVEGPYLRIRSGGSTSSDQKLHFRSIVDYTTYGDRDLRNCGIQSLSLTTTGGGEERVIVMPGIVNCLEVRDTLAEIDRLREYC